MNFVLQPNEALEYLDTMNSRKSCYQYPLIFAECYLDDNPSCGKFIGWNPCIQHTFGDMIIPYYRVLVRLAGYVTSRIMLHVITASSHDTMSLSYHGET